MSRSGYTDDCDDPLSLGRWRAQVNSAIRGKRGQQFLRDLIAALDALPEKELIAGDLVDDEGCVCALGALGSARNIDLESMDTYDYDALGAAFNIAYQLAQEVMYENDEHVSDTKYMETEICGPVRPYWPEYGKHLVSYCAPDENAAKKRWQHVRDWAVRNIAINKTEAANKQNRP